MVTVCCTGPGAHDWLIEMYFLYRCLVVFGLSPCGPFIKLWKLVMYNSYRHIPAYISKGLVESDFSQAVIQCLVNYVSAKETAFT
jgi:hypothetical protein